MIRPEQIERGHRVRISGQLYTIVSVDRFPQARPYNFLLLFFRLSKVRGQGLDHAFLTAELLESGEFRLASWRRFNRPGLPTKFVEPRELFGWKIIDCWRFEQRAGFAVRLYTGVPSGRWRTLRIMAFQPMRGAALSWYSSGVIKPEDITRIR